METPALPTSLLPPGLELRFDNTIGVALLAAIFNSVLYGILCLQCYAFFQRSEKDSPLLKYSVGALWILDTVHLAFICQCIYTYAVTNFGNIVQLLLIPWPISTSILVTGLTILLVQGWFCYRVWIMSHKSRLLTYPLILVIMAGVCLSLVNNIKLYFLPTFASFQNQLHLYIAEVTAFAVGDFYIAISLCCLLFRERRTVNPKYLHTTYSMLNTLIIYTIETGLLTSFVALASLITCLTMRDNFIFVGIYLLLSGLYSNSLMASLNARKKFRRQAVASIPLGMINMEQSLAFTSSGQAELGGVGGIQVSRDTTIIADDASKTTL